jgi:hypothetical protein
LQKTAMNEMNHWLAHDQCFFDSLIL